MTPLASDQGQRFCLPPKKNFVVCPLLSKVAKKLAKNCFIWQHQQNHSDSDSQPMKACTQVLLVIAAMAAGLMVSHAQSFSATLDPSQEVPPHNTPAYGDADFTLSFGTNLTVNAGTGTYADLLAGATSIRVSDAGPGTNGPTLFTLTLTDPGTTTGTFSGRGSLTASQVNDLMAGYLYVNIADSIYPSGEIRGQIEMVVPEPSTLTLAVAGSLALLASRRGPEKEL
jgi:CHRD domain